MGTHSIEQVSAITDAVDRFHWQTRFATDFLTPDRGRYYAFQWDGMAAFYREEIPANTMPGPNCPRRTLPARWSNRRHASRIYGPGEVKFEFDTDVTRDAFDSIERFRDCGRLFARLEGALTIVPRGTADGPNGWLEGLGRLMGDSSTTLDVQICTAPYELTRDKWCAEILTALRPPGRYIIEVPIPPPIDGSEATLAQGIMGHISEAKDAFDNGRYDDAARIAYRALEQLQSEASTRLTERYGSYAQKRINDDIKALTAICNAVRHREDPLHDGLSFDRRLAQYLLIGTQNLVAVVLAGSTLDAR